MCSYTSRNGGVSRIADCPTLSDYQLSVRICYYGNSCRPSCTYMCKVLINLIHNN